jgi:hypothetical protein
MIEPELLVYEKEIHLRHPANPTPHLRFVLGPLGIEVYATPYQKLICTPEQMEAFAAGIKALAAKARAKPVGATHASPSEEGTNG